MRQHGSLVHDEEVNQAAWVSFIIERISMSETFAKCITLLTIGRRAWGCCWGCEGEFL